MNSPGPFDRRILVLAAAALVGALGVLTEHAGIGLGLAAGVAAGRLPGWLRVVLPIGIVVGTYSSIYVAAPTLLLLEKRFGEPVKTA